MILKPHGFKGTFITMEGIDGCGKSSQITRFVEKLNKDLSLGRWAVNWNSVVVGREPGSTPLCMKLREVLLSKDEERWSYPSETLLFFADRMQHLSKCVIPTIEDGRVYVSDRYVDSTLAYQGLRGMDLSLIKSLIMLLEIPSPDITFWIKLDPATAHERAQARAEKNLYDAKPLSFYQKLHDQFQHIFDHDPRVVVVDATGSIEEVAARVWAGYVQYKNNSETH